MRESQASRFLASKEGADWTETPSEDGIGMTRNSGTVLPHVSRRVPTGRGSEKKTFWCF